MTTTVTVRETTLSDGSRVFDVIFDHGSGHIEFDTFDDAGHADRFSSDLLELLRKYGFIVLQLLRKERKMKKIINGLRYNTDNAIMIGSYSSNDSVSDFRHWTASLYRTPRSGRYFLVGEGGPMSRYGESLPGGMGYGSKLKPLTKEGALEWAQTFLDAQEVEDHFADAIEDA